MNTKNKLQISQEIIFITILPAFNIFGIICNLICARIFKSNKFYNNIYRYLTTNSIVDAIYLIFFALAPFTQCLALCESWLNPDFLKFYKKYVVIYICRVLDTISSLINVSMVIDRLLCINRIRFKNQKTIFVSVIVLFTVYSSLLYLPNLLIIDISFKAIGNMTLESVTGLANITKLYKIEKKNLFSNLVQYGQYGQYFTVAVSMLIVIISNILLIYQLNTNFKRKNITKFSTTTRLRKRCSSSNEDVPSNELKKKNYKEATIGYIQVRHKSNSVHEKNTTILVILLSLFFILNQISTQLIQFAFFRLELSVVLYNFIAIFHTVVSLTFHGANVFLYYKYNKEFSFKIRSIFLKRQVH